MNLKSLYAVINVGANLKKMKFECSGCGICCQLAGKNGLMPSNDDGSCIYLDIDNKCKIYDERPDICNVSKMYKHRAKNGLDISFKEYCKLSARACNTMMEQNNIDKRYRLDERVYDE